MVSNANLVNFDYSIILSNNNSQNIRKLMEIPFNDGKYFNISLKQNASGGDDSFYLEIYDKNESVKSPILSKSIKFSEKKPLTIRFSRKNKNTEIYINGEYTINQDFIDFSKMRNLNYFFSGGLKYKYFTVTDKGK